MDRKNGDIVRIEYYKDEGGEALEEVIEGNVVESMAEVLSRELKLPPSVAGRIRREVIRR